MMTECRFWIVNSLALCTCLGEPFNVYEETVFFYPYIACC